MNQKKWTRIKQIVNKWIKIRTYHRSTDSILFFFFARTCNWDRRAISLPANDILHIILLEIRNCLIIILKHSVAQSWAIYLSYVVFCLVCGMGEEHKTQKKKHTHNVCATLANKIQTQRNNFIHMPLMRSILQHIIRCIVYKRSDLPTIYALLSMCRRLSMLVDARETTKITSLLYFGRFVQTTSL